MTKLFSDEVPLELNTLEGLTEYMQRPILRPSLPTRAEYDALSRRERIDVDELRLDYLGSDLAISTPQVDEVVKLAEAALRYNRRKHIGRVGAMISGRPTMGKTTAAVAAMRFTFEHFTTDIPDWDERGLIPVVFVNVPAGSTPKRMMGRFADFLGLPIQRQASKDEIELLIARHLNRARTKLVVIDEVQNLKGQNRSSGDSVDVLKDLSNMVQATFLYTGIDIHKGDMLSGVRGQQIAGRSSLVTLDRYTIANADEKRQWRTIIASFENELLLYSHTPGDLARDHYQHLYDLAQGKINTLARLLLGAAQEVIHEGRGSEFESIALDHLDRIKVDIVAEERAAALAEIAAKEAKVGHRRARARAGRATAGGDTHAA